jgi:hypothetical protein
MPRLREVRMDYHRLPIPLMAFTMGRPLRCKDVGEYHLQCDQLRLEFRDTPLASVWKAFISLPPLKPDQTHRSSFAAAVVLRPTVKRIVRRHGRNTLYRTLVKVDFFLRIHDAGWMPLVLARIWPHDLPADYRSLALLATPDFLHKFTQHLQHFVADEDMAFIPPLVRRW